MPPRRLAFAAPVALIAAAVACARAGDWPQILGPARDGLAAADERIAAWPEAGPRRVWSAPVGAGYAGVAVAAGRVYLFHRLDDREVLVALDAATGKAVWSDGHATSFVPQVGGGAGPLCVPLVDDDRVIVFGAQGVLAAVDAASGARRWSRDTHRDYGAAEGYFGAGSAPVVVAGRVVVNVGGARREAGLVAFDRDSGATVWTATGDAAGYSAPVAVRAAGRPHVLAVTRSNCLLVDAADGQVRWSFPFGRRGPTVNAASPLVFADGHLLVTASYGVGCVYAAFDERAARPLWQGETPLATQYGTPVAVGDHLYAIDGRDDVPPADLVCIERATGREAWRERGFGYGTLLGVGGRLVVAKTDGELLLVAADPRRLDVLARARPFGADLTGALRALPALAAGRLYLRDDATLICLDLAP